MLTVKSARADYITNPYHLITLSATDDDDVSGWLWLGFGCARGIPHFRFPHMAICEADAAENGLMRSCLWLNDLNDLRRSQK
jgi:hypothetical protein